MPENSVRRATAGRSETILREGSRAPSMRHHTLRCSLSGRRLALLSLATALFITSASGSDYTWRNLQFGGFASQGFLKSSANDYLGETSEGTWDFREYAANASWSQGSWRIGAQVFGQKLGEYGDDKIKLDWASIDFQPKQWFGVRAGRVKMPRGLYNEALDVDSVRPFVLLPQSVYDARLRDFNASFDGGMLYGNVPVGRLGSVDYRFYHGATTIALDSGATDYFNTDSPYHNTGIGIDGMRGLSLFWNTPLSGLRVGYSYNALQDFRVDRLLPLPPTEEMPVWIDLPVFRELKMYERHLVSAEYIRGDWVFAAEAGVERGKWDIGVTGTPAWNYLRAGYYYAYASAARRINPWLELGTYVSYSKDESTIPQWPIPMPDARHYDYALSARFDVNEHTIVKLEGHYMSMDGVGKLFNTAANPVSPLTADPSWTMIAAKVTFQF